MSDPMDRLQQILSDTPALPETIYPAVMGPIRRRTVLTRTLLAMAACLVMTVGIVSYKIGSGKPPVAVSPEVEEELQWVQSFLTGENLEQQYAQYLVVDYSLED
jgi:hypothetical protein